MSSQSTPYNRPSGFPAKRAAGLAASLLQFQDPMRSRFLMSTRGWGVDELGDMVGNDGLVPKKGSKFRSLFLSRY